MEDLATSMLSSPSAWYKWLVIPKGALPLFLRKFNDKATWRRSSMWAGMLV